MEKKKEKGRFLKTAERLGLKARQKILENVSNRSFWLLLAFLSIMNVVIISNTPSCVSKDDTNATNYLNIRKQCVYRGLAYALPYTMCKDDGGMQFSLIFNVLLGAFASYVSLTMSSQTFGQTEAAAIVITTLSSKLWSTLFFFIWMVSLFYSIGAVQTLPSSSCKACCNTHTSLSVCEEDVCNQGTTVIPMTKGTFTNSIMGMDILTLIYAVFLFLSFRHM